jgi:hypothetical protein
MARYSKKAQKAISREMRAQKGKSRPRKQKVAIALSMARAKGLKVPKGR